MPIKDGRVVSKACRNLSRSTDSTLPGERYEVIYLRADFCCEINPYLARAETIVDTLNLSRTWKNLNPVVLCVVEVCPDRHRSPRSSIWLIWNVTMSSLEELFKVCRERYWQSPCSIAEALQKPSAPTNKRKLEINGHNAGESTLRLPRTLLICRRCRV